MFYVLFYACHGGDASCAFCVLTYALWFEQKYLHQEIKTGNIELIVFSYFKNLDFKSIKNYRGTTVNLLLLALSESTILDDVNSIISLLSVLPFVTTNNVFPSSLRV